MFTPSFLHITNLYIVTSLHTHQYLFMRALYIYIFFLSDIFISFPLSYISRYTPLRSRAIRRLVQLRKLLLGTFSCLFQGFQLSFHLSSAGHGRVSLLQGRPLLGLPLLPPFASCGPRPSWPFLVVEIFIHPFSRGGSLTRSSFFKQKVQIFFKTKKQLFQVKAAGNLFQGNMAQHHYKGE